jgi:peptide-methionine (S)-S-oxide reductase
MRKMKQMSVTKKVELAGAKCASEKWARALRQWMISLGVVVLVFSSAGCAQADSQVEIQGGLSRGELAAVATPAQGKAAAMDAVTFAGGCFWCMEQPFDALPGVVSTTSGYTGGTVENPTYGEVSNGDTGHFEAMQVRFDPQQVSYETLLDTFWHNIDPLDSRGQFCDKGAQYRSAIFYNTPQQQQAAEESKAAIAQKLNQPIATEILPAAAFYEAEDYHQNYYQTRPVRYKVYRFGCGRDQRLAEVWGNEAPIAHE